MSNKLKIIEGQNPYIRCVLVDKCILEFNKMCNKIDLFNDGECIMFKATMRDDPDRFIILGIVPLSQIREIQFIHSNETIESFK